MATTRGRLERAAARAGYYDRDLDERKREWIRRVDRYADVIYVSPRCSRFRTRQAR